MSSRAIFALLLFASVPAFAAPPASLFELIVGRTGRLIFLESEPASELARHLIGYRPTTSEDLLKLRAELEVPARRALRERLEKAFVEIASSGGSTPDDILKAASRSFEKISAEHLQGYRGRRETFLASGSEEAIHAEMSKNMRTYADVYRSALNAGEGHARMLQILGADIRSAEIVIPAPRELVRRYLRHMGDLVRSGRVKAAEVLRPGLAVKNAADEYRFIPYGEVPPIGYQVEEGFIPTKQFYRMIAEGYFPVGGPALSNDGAGNFVTYFEHDLGHFTAFMESPRLMAELRASAIEAMKLPEKVLEDWSFMRRAYYVSEALVIIRPSATGGIRAALERSSKTTGIHWETHPTLPEVRKILVQLPAEVLLPIAREWNELMPRSYQKLGGAARDLFNGYGVQATLHNSLQAGKELLETSINQGWTESSARSVPGLNALLRDPRPADPTWVENVEWVRDNVADALARIMTHSNELVELEATDFIREGLQAEKLKPTSRLYRFFCKSEIRIGEEYVWAFCP